MNGLVPAGAARRGGRVLTWEMKGGDCNLLTTRMVKARNLGIFKGNPSQKVRVLKSLKTRKLDSFRIKNIQCKSHKLNI